MSVGQLAMKHPSLAAMVLAIEARISRVALHYRFSSAAAAFLFKCLQFVLQQKLACVGQLETKLLRPFPRVLIADSSSWDVSEKLRNALPGSGGSASAANCKLQTLYDYKHGQLQFLDVTPGIVPDNRYTDNLPALLQERDLILADLGYFKIATFVKIAAKGAFFLSRFLVGTTVRKPLTQTPINLEKHLRKSRDIAFEMKTVLGTEKSSQLPSRLIALRVNPRIANERRRRLKKEAKKKHRTVSRHHLRMCDWTLFLTNIPQPCLPLALVRALYTLRWQIELLFKQLKSVLRIHQSNTGNENRLLCELYGKLIAAVIIHRIHAAETITLWSTRSLEVSIEKLYKRLQERAFFLLHLLRHSLRNAIAYLRAQLKLIIPTCLKIPQPSRLTTLQMIHALSDPNFNIKNTRTLKQRR